MRNSKIIGFGGQLGSGKDEAANYLAKALDGKWLPHLTWTRNAFANALKKVFQDSFNVNRDFIEQWKRVPEPPEGFDLPLRDCLILIGDGFRKMKSNIWIETACRLGTDQIISDCRYVNETEYIRKNDGIAILMWRPGHENDIQNGSEQEYMPYVRYLRDIKFNDGEIYQHMEVPESYWNPPLSIWQSIKNYFDLTSAPVYKHKIPKDRHIPFDLWIKNDGTKEDLYKKIDNIVIPYVIKRYDMYKA